MKAIGALILAAGGSTRLGEPKQLLRYRGETLVRRAACAALGAGCLPTVIVTGAEHEKIATELAGLNVRLSNHLGWRSGIGSSIRAGLQQACASEPALDAVIIMVCDQPFVMADCVAALISARRQSGSRAAACAYAGTIGVPALFDHTLFSALAALPDEEGAKSILSSMGKNVARVEFPAGVFDLDTPADLSALHEGQTGSGF